MSDYAETMRSIKQYLSARVPLIVVKSQERSRVKEMMKEIAASLRVMPFYGYSRTEGLFQIQPYSVIADDASLQTAIDQARNQFKSVDNVNFVFEDIDDIASDTPTARELAATVLLAEQHHQGCIILMTDKPVWSGLSMLGMLAELDLPNTEEILVEIAGIINMHQGIIPISWSPEEVHQAAEILTGVSLIQAVNIVTTLIAKGQVTSDDISELSKYKDRIIGSLAGIERVKVSSKNQVGGLRNLRKWLDTREELMRADLSASAVRPPRGILLCGVPGCGKSLSAKAIAHRWKLPLYRLDMSAVLGMYVGQSEAQFKEALEAADKVAPCILWVDEIEKALSGSNDSTGVQRRIIGQFLYWLQESTSKVFMVATANDVRSLPPELLRKGRFDEVFFVDLPEADERAEILRMYFTRYLDFDLPPDLQDDLVEMTEGFSGSDIDASVNDIAITMLATHTTTVPGDTQIKQFFANVVPYSRTNPEDLMDIREWGASRAVPAGVHKQRPTESASPAGRQVVFL
ncbi:MAG: AAA family ATPase [Coriobacteriaceae bacterium]|jgi:ATP-dependent 26S proteasome regulatory subunit|nr:AAA family ATPase [Coriobacteriaceae bacterium]